MWWWWWTDQSLPALAAPLAPHPRPPLFTKLRLLQVSLGKEESAHMQLDPPYFRGLKEGGSLSPYIYHVENHQAVIIAACGISPSLKLPADKTLQRLREELKKRIQIPCDSMLVGMDVRFFFFFYAASLRAEKKMQLASEWCFSFLLSPSLEAETGFCIVGNSRSASEIRLQGNFLKTGGIKKSALRPLLQA